MSNLVQGRQYYVCELIISKDSFLAGFLTQRICTFCKSHRINDKCEINSRYKISVMFLHHFFFYITFDWRIFYISLITHWLKILMYILIKKKEINRRILVEYSLCYVDIVLCKKKKKKTEITNQNFCGK